MSRAPILYIAPWVDFGGTDKGTIDWFRWIDRDRFAPSLITTQPSPNRRLAEVVPYADEVWALPELFSGGHYPRFILDFIASRRIGVVHIMNSRLGFDLLPDLRALPERPRVVVQLHVEEETRDGYVRYVTTRYGNLVDCFSVTSEHLAEAVRGYGVAGDRIAVIPTGVDAEDEFSPESVMARPGLRGGSAVEILYPGRLVEQKDPLLMVEVAAELQRRELDFRIHVVGDGDLEESVRSRVGECGLHGRIAFERPSRELASWYAGSDLLLMTSVFEGVPYVAYEAMAMALPVVAPALPGNVELMNGVGGALVDGRDPSAFADALEPLIRSEARRREVGAAGRERMRAQFDVRTMADSHVALYDRLLDGVAFPPRRRARTAEPIAFAQRPSRGTPLVSVITPCFNHGAFLRETVASVLAQDYPSVEMVVADDGSTEQATRRYLDELEAGSDVRVVRLKRNRGPSAARNAAVAVARGRYILPVDSDNVLLADAISRLVSQLQGAGDHVGFVYPTIQYFGNREEYFEPPAYNAWLLTQGNYIDTCALIDRTVFDAGIRYPEDIVLGHEDWDFFLDLLDRGVHGEPARGKTLRYRKHGFTRSDLVDSSSGAYHESVPSRHPAVFAKPDDIRGDNPHVALKARWAPALSVVALAPVRAGTPDWDALMAGLARQSLRDADWHAALDRAPRAAEAGPPLHRLPTRLDDAPGDVVAEMMDRVASPNLMFTYGTGSELLADPGGLERVLRALEQGPASGVIAFADAAAPGGFDWEPLPVDGAPLVAHSIVVSRRHLPLRVLPDELDAGDPLGELVRWYQMRRITVDWRRMALRSPLPEHRSARRRRRPRTPRQRAELSERSSRLHAPSELPGCSEDPKRWRGLWHWAPIGGLPLVRHVQPSRGEWVLSNDPRPPEHFERDRVLGISHGMAFEGTERLVKTGDSWAIVPRGAEPDAVEMERSLGYVDQAPLPMFEALLLCRHAQTGAPVVVCGSDDPLNDDVQWPQLAVLGWIDRWPIGPATVPRSPENDMFLRGIVRALDPARRGFVTGIGEAPEGDGRWEIGAAVDRDPGGGVPIWTDADGRLHTELYHPGRYPLSPRRTAHWVAAPATWRGIGVSAAPRLRSIARRTGEALVHGAADLRGRAPAAPRPPQGWLLPEGGPGRYGIVSAIHPVTSDQLVTRDLSEVEELGYEDPRILGYALAAAPVTGDLRHGTLAAVPWGDHFGGRLTLSQDPLDPR